MKTKPVILLLVAVASQSRVWGQKEFELDGRLTDCADSTAMFLGQVTLLQGDSIFAVRGTDTNGKFRFEGLRKGMYELRTAYFYYPSLTAEVQVPQKREIELCIASANEDSLLTAFKPGSDYVIYYFGLPVYTDAQLNMVSRKYGVRYENFGCVGNDWFDKYNAMIRKILERRNGAGWEKRFWVEVKQQYDDE